MIQILKEFYNGIEDCQEIYDNNYKILEVNNNILWNTDEKHPICIVKRRRTDYTESNVPAEEIIDKNI